MKDIVNKLEDGMHERLKELAHQADLVIKKRNGDDFRFGGMDPKLEKFAQLIVKECIDNLIFHGCDDDVRYLEWMAANKLGVKL